LGKKQGGREKIPKENCHGRRGRSRPRKSRKRATKRAGSGDRSTPFLAKEEGKGTIGKKREKAAEQTNRATAGSTS